MKVPGYMTAKEALGNGFTHHGTYFGIPLWVAPENPDFPVAAKWAPMECIVTAAMLIECTMRSCFFPDDEACFQFGVGKKIILSLEQSGNG